MTVVHFYDKEHHPASKVCFCERIWLHKLWAYYILDLHIMPNRVRDNLTYYTILMQNSTNRVSGTLFVFLWKICPLEKDMTYTPVNVNTDSRITYVFPEI